MSKHITSQLHFTIDETALTAIALSYESFLSPEIVSWFNTPMLDAIVEQYCPEWETETLENGTVLMHLYFGSFTNDAGGFDDLVTFLNYFIGCGVKISGVFYEKKIDGFVNAVSLHHDSNVVAKYMETVEGKFIQTSPSRSSLLADEKYEEYDTAHKEYLNFEIRFWDSTLERV